MEKRKNKRFGGEWLALEESTNRQQQAAFHAALGFIATYGVGAYLHAANRSFGSIIGPGNLGFELGGAIELSVFSQPQ
jgi:hypothetical protein